MKLCDDCKYAEWKRTKAGKLHPLRQGACTYQYKLPELPASMWWHSSAPRPSGGYIQRKEELKTHCVYYQRG